MKDDWVLIYEGGGSGCVSLFGVPLAIATLSGAVLCFGNLLELVGLLRLPRNFEFDFTRALTAPASSSEWAVIASYFLFVAGAALCTWTRKIVKSLWTTIAISRSTKVVYEGVLSHMRFEYPGWAPQLRVRGKSTTAYWRLTAGEKTWRIRHTGPAPFEYELKPGAEIRVKYPSRGGPDDLIELWVKKGTNLEARMEIEEWLQVYGQKSVWQLLLGPLFVLLYYLPCAIFLLAASLFGIYLWVGVLLQFAGIVILPPAFDWSLKKELARAAWYQKPLFGLIYLGAGAACVALAGRTLKGLWRLVAEVQPLVYEGRLDKVYEAPRNRRGGYWLLTAGEKSWRIDAFAYTFGNDRTWFAHEIKPGREIRAVYPKGGETDILELWLKDRVIRLEKLEPG
jgi:hypothetical protein